MIQLVKDVYQTYRGDNESHSVRILMIFFASAAVGYFGINLADKSLPTMSMAISILAGFTFTALFSSHAMATNDLPKSRTENDRNDLKRLKVLGNNFRIRSCFFITLSVFNLVIILLLTTEMPFREIFERTCAFLENICGYFSSSLLESLAISINNTICVFLTFLSFAFFFESLYTFYRLTETILAILNIRREYLEAHNNEI